MNKFVIFVATGGFVGFCPVAPGTAGALVGFFLSYLISVFPHPIYLLTSAALFFLGAWAAERAEIIFGRNDSPKIVIDEVLGALATMAFVPLTVGTAIVGFLFFRLFDIMKPFPAGRIDRRMKGGFAVVLDDAVAGLYANLTLQLIHWVNPQVFSGLELWIRSLR